MMNPMQMIAQFNNFRRSYQGDPKAEVEKLVAEGKISQQQLNQLQQMATQFQQMLNQNGSMRKL